MEATTIGSLISLQRGYDLTESQRRPGKIPIVGSAGVHGYHDKAREPLDNER
jgi:type I restriction enzyme S subunit